MPRGKPEAPLIDRFLRRVNKQGKKVSDELGHCWEWLGGRYTNDYGQLSDKVWGEHTTHRWSYRHFNNQGLPIEEGLEVCHKCDNRFCVNPEHLTAEPKIENIKQKNERHGQPNNRSFTREEVADIKALRATGAFYKDIAEQYGCNRRTIERICTGFYYKEPPT
jgi:hypothetical protein